MIRIFRSKNKLRLKDYSKLNTEDKDFIDYTISNSLKANSKLSLGRKILKPKRFDFWKLSWNDIILLRSYIESKDIKEVHKLVYEITDKNFISLDLINCMACYKWVVQEIDNINNTESSELGSDPSQEDKEAGIERLQEFGYSVSLYGFRGSDISKDKELKNTQYAKIFKEMCMRKVIAEINKEKEQNARKKNTRNR